MIPEKSQRIDMLKAVRALLEIVEWSYVQDENRKYEGGFVPEDGSLRSDEAHSIIRAVEDLIEREDSDE